MTSHQQPEIETIAAVDSVTSSPRADLQSHDQQARVRFMCSFGGKILPRPHDNQLRYVGGDTRIVAANRHTNFSVLLNKLSKLSGTNNITVKYQLPSEDLDALITVSSDEDVENMMEEFDRLVQSHGSKSTRLRLFLFQPGEESRTSSISSLLDGSVRRENWFFDALNGGSSGLERGRSEASSMVSEVPDYLFGLDNSDETQAREPKLGKNRPGLTDNVSASDPGSPAPGYSPYCSASSVTPYLTPIPDLPPVKTRPENPTQVVEPNIERGSPRVAQTGFAGNPRWNYIHQVPHYPGQVANQMPVYYVSGPVPPNSIPGQHLPVQHQFIQQFSAPPGQIPGMVQIRPPAATSDPYGASPRFVPDGLNRNVYYGAGMMQAYPGMVHVGPGGEENPVLGSGGDGKTGRVQ